MILYGIFLGVTRMRWCHAQNQGGDGPLKRHAAAARNANSSRRNAYQCGHQTKRHAYIHMHAHTHTCTYTNAHAHTHAHTPTHANAHAHTHTHTHTHAHTNTRTCSEQSLRILVWSASSVQKQSSLTWQERVGEQTRERVKKKSFP